MYNISTGVFYSVRLSISMLIRIIILTIVASYYRQSVQTLSISSCSVNLNILQQIFVILRTLVIKYVSLQKYRTLLLFLFNNTAVKS